MKWLQEILFKQQLNSMTSKSGFMNWEQVKEVALVISAPLTVSKNDLDRWITQSNKRIDVIYCEPNTKPSSFADWQCLTKEKSSWTGLPKTEVLQAYQKKYYDVVICLSKDIHYFEQSLVVAIHASVKVSSLEHLPYYSICISHEGVNTPIQYLEACVKYLAMIRTK
jgi:hypothetical protein